MLNKKIRLTSLLLATLIVAACAEKSQPRQDRAAPAVTVVTLSSQAVTLTRQLPGRTNPFKVAEVRPQVDGLVKALLFKEGGLVDAEQPLYQLDDAIYRADFDSAKASLQRTKAALMEMQLSAERSQKLIATGAVSKQDNDSAIAMLQKAKADVAAARAALRRSKIQLQYARISAPIAGRIGVSSVTQGALVTAGQVAPLATVQQLDPIYVELTQSSGELLSLRKALTAGTVTNSDNFPVTVLLEDGSPYQHAGKLEFAEVRANPSTGSVLLRAVVPNPEHLLLPGMYVRAVIGRGVREHAILVPQRGIGRSPTGTTTAMVVNKENVVEQRDVQVSQTIGDQWLVESGLQVGDRVIIEGLQKVRPGGLVQASEAVKAKVASTRSAAAVSTVVSNAVNVKKG